MIKEINETDRELVVSYKVGDSVIEILKRIRKEFIDDAQSKFSNNRNMAASYLGVNRTTLVEMLRRNGHKLHKSTRVQAAESIENNQPQNIRIDAPRQ